MSIKTLLVDDERSLLEQAEVFLDRLDQEIELQTASSAEKALEMMSEENFDVIVSDYQMPGTDGIEFLEKIREERNSEIPFIMFTGKGREKVAMKALNLGADRYLHKGGDLKSQYGVLADAIEQEVKHRSTEEILELTKYSVEKASPEIYWITPEGKFTYVNEAVADCLGYSKEELKDMHIWDIDPNHGRNIRQERWEELKEKGILKFESEHQTKEGEIYPVEITSQYIEHEDKEYEFAFAKDITKRKRAKEKLKNNEERYRRLFESAQDGLLIIDSETGVIEDANPYLQDILGYSKEDLVGKEVWELGPFENVIDNKKSFEELIEEDYRRYEDLTLDTTDDDEVPVELVVNTYEVGEKEVVQCNLREISERKESQQELKRKEKYLDHTPDFFIVLDEGGEIKYYSSPSPGIEGLDPSKVVGFEGIELVHPDDREDIQEMFSKVLENPGEEYSMELRGETEDGWRWLSVRAINHLDDPEINGIIITSRDISKRKKAEEELKRSKERYKKLFNASPDVTFFLDKDGVFQEINQAGVDILGYKREEIIGEHILEVPSLPRGAKEKIAENFKKRLQGKEIDPYTIEAETKNGGRLFGEVNAAMIEENGEPVGAIGIVRNITERKEAEIKYKKIFESAKDAIVIMKNKRVVDCNDKALEIFGYDREDFIDKTPYEFLPEKQPNGTDLQEKAIEKINKALQGEPQEFNWIQTTEDGDHLYVEASLNQYMVEGDRFIMAIIRDITYRKEAEEQYRAIVDTSPEAIVITDLEGKIIDCNQKTLEMAGSISKDEIIGKNAFDLIAPEYREKAAKNLKKTLKEKNIKDMEYTFLDLDGNKFPAELSAGLIRDSEGDPVSFMGIIRDITDRKEAKESLKENKKKIERVHEISAELQTCQSEKEIYSFAVEAAKEVLDFDVCGISLLESDKRNRIRAISSVREETSLNNSIPIEDSLAGMTRLKNRSFLIKDIENREDIKPSSDRFKSGMSIPIKDDSVFQLLSTETDHFDKEDLNLAELLVSHVSEALDRVQMEEREEFIHSLLRHDVGNKTRIIDGYLELMKDYDLPEEVKDLRDKTELAVKKSINIIDKVKKLREIEERKEIGEMDVNAVVDKVVSEHRDRLREEGPNIDMDVCDCTVRGGPLLEELFSNLMENSIQHSDCDEIRISSKKKEDECLVTIEDDGVGISDEIKDRIFEKGFKRGKNSGTGLGLYIVKEIVEAYYGSVEVKDSEMGGVGFEIHLQRFHSK